MEPVLIVSGSHHKVYHQYLALKGFRCSSGYLKPGRKVGYKKPTTMKGRLAVRIPVELEMWLLEEGTKRGLGIGDMARMLLIELKQKAKESDYLGSLQTQNLDFSFRPRNL